MNVLSCPCGVLLPSKNKPCHFLHSTWSVTHNSTLTKAGRKMDAAKEGNVDLFLELTNSMGQDKKQSRIVQRTREIFQSQIKFLFGSSAKEELRAALREATAIENCECYDDIAKEAATENVLQLAEDVRELHKNSPYRDYYVNGFLRAAYDMKRMFRLQEE